MQWRTVDCKDAKRQKKKAESGSQRTVYWRPVGRGMVKGSSRTAGFLPFGSKGGAFYCGQDRNDFPLAAMYLV